MGQSLKEILGGNRVVPDGRKAQRHEIKCPHCPDGHTIVLVEWKRGQLQVDTAQAHECNECKRYFTIGIRIKLYGKPIK